MKTRVELPILIETITEEEYVLIMNKIEEAILNIDGVLEVEQSIGYEED